MTPPKKPEWIEIAEKDKSIFPHKVSKGLPVVALVVTASIIGIGSIFAQSAQESPANTVEISAPAVQNSPTVSTVSADSKSTQPSNVEAAVSTTKIAFTPNVASTTTSIKNPSLGTMPTGGGDDEFEGDDDEFEGDDDEFEGDDD